MYIKPPRAKKYSLAPLYPSRPRLALEWVSPAPLA